MAELERRLADMAAQIAQVDSESDDLARRLQELLRQQEEKQREKAELERSVRRVQQQLEEQLRRREAMVAELSRACDVWLDDAMQLAAAHEAPLPPGETVVGAAATGS